MSALTVAEAKSGVVGMPPAIVEARGLSKHFRTQYAVRDLSLAIPRGGVFGLVGPNGSGKTTLISLMLGLIRPSAGAVRLFGQMRGPDRQALRRVGATVETPAFYSYLSGRANLQFFQGISRRGKLQEIEVLLERVGLAARAESAYHTYSLGMKQRLAIAFALLGEPELIFLDEPTNGLDPAGVVEIRELIKSLGTQGRTVVLSSHLLHEVEQVCDHIAVLV